jgi:hypothetical protein
VTGEPFSYSASQAGEFVGHTEHWMLKNARDRVIPHSKVGDQIRFTPAHIQQILDACEVQPLVPLKPRATARREPAPAPGPPPVPALVPRAPRERRRSTALGHRGRKCPPRVPEVRGGRCVPAQARTARRAADASIPRE